MKMAMVDRRRSRLSLGACAAVVSLFFACAPNARAADGSVFAFPSPPPTGWLSTGAYPITWTIHDPLGTQYTKAYFSEPGPTTVELASWVSSCDPRVGKSCPTSAGPFTWVLRPQDFDDGVHDLVVGESNTITAIVEHFQIRIDHTAPPAPSGLSVDGGDRWRSQNRFSINWVNPRNTGPTPITGIVYRLCPAANRAEETAGCVEGSRDGSNIDWIDDMSMPSGGAWRLRLALKDEAGNADLDDGATLTGLRFDGTPPSVAFGPRSPDDPARVQVYAGDAESGVAGVEIEIRRLNDTSWRSLPVTTGAGAFTAVLPDDDLPAGSYEIRTRAVDAVGNERSLSSLQASPGFTIALPIREASVLALSTAAAGNTRPAWTAEPLIRSLGFGRRLRLEGRLTDAMDRPRAYSPIEVREGDGSTWRSLGTVRTGRDGAFRYTVAPGSSRTIRFDYAGSSTIRSASAEATVRVRAGVVLGVSRTRARNGQSVRFLGHLEDTRIPEEGKAITLQALTTRGWRTFATTRAVGTGARFAYRYQFTATTATSRYRFRALVPRDAGYPYFSGVSKTVSVLVRGS